MESKANSVGDRKRGEGWGHSTPDLISQGKKFKFYSRHNRKSTEKSKWRKDTFYLHFLEDGSGSSA